MPAACPLLSQRHAWPAWRCGPPQQLACRQLR
jgi:hypothetical protein